MSEETIKTPGGRVLRIVGSAYGYKHYGMADGAVRVSLDYDGSARISFCDERRNGTLDECLAFLDARADAIVAALRVDR